jgi:hypothetical protein
MESGHHPRQLQLGLTRINCACLPTGEPEPVADPLPAISCRALGRNRYTGISPSTVQRRITRRCVAGSYAVARCIRQRLSHAQDFRSELRTQWADRKRQAKVGGGIHGVERGQRLLRTDVADAGRALEAADRFGQQQLRQP